MKDNNEIICLHAEFCEDLDCLLNLEGSCQDIGTILYGNKIGGLCTPLTCSSAVHPWNEKYAENQP